jgi:CDP-6-deoxy-D-xylo-4-hexulose-3-dehydrase
VSGPFYPLASSTWDDEEYAAMQQVIKNGKFTMGEQVSTYEENFAEYIGSKYAVMSNSGSSANLLMIAGAKYVKDSPLKEGDSIIVPAVSWSTTYYPIHQLGYELSFVDIDIETLNLDCDAVEKSITDNTKCIFAVNLLGNPANLNRLREIAKNHNLILFEDNCESLGSQIENKFTGTFGTAGTFSSFFSHHISTMEGGVTVTNDTNLYEAMLSLRAHGWTRELPKNNSVFTKTGEEWDDYFRFVLPGYNLRPLELEGALGITQLKKLDSFVEQRRQNAVYLFNNTNSLKHIKFQKEFGRSSWFGFSILLTGPLQGKRKLLVQNLSKASIESRPVVAGNFARNPVLKHLRHKAIPKLVNADFIHENGLFVGNHHYPMQPQLDRLCDVLETFENENA